MVLEQVCSPVRECLHVCTRDDTVHCIVASLTDDSSNELADVSGSEAKLFYIKYSGL